MFFLTCSALFAGLCKAVRYGLGYRTFCSGFFQPQRHFCSCTVPITASHGGIFFLGFYSVPSCTIFCCRTGRCGFLWLLPAFWAVFSGASYGYLCFRFIFCIGFSAPFSFFCSAFFAPQAGLSAENSALFG